MSEPTSISTGIAERYATAIFELAKDDNALSQLEADFDALATAEAESADLHDMITSPIYSREEQAAGITAIADKMGLGPTVKNALALMASKRRLFVLPQVAQQLREMIAEEKGEVTADVVSATALTQEQSDKLVASLSQSVGKTVKLNSTVDETLIGGLVVKVGSTMIDTSVRSKLAALQNTMKEVG